jgi:3-oxoacyl-[acyl-carrier protein] reductase
MRIDLTGKVALVTGGAGGIGRAVSFTLAEAGARVVVTDIAENLGDNVPKHAGRSMRYRKMDVGSLFDVTQVVQEIAQIEGGLDILVNNAGIMNNFALMKDHDPELFIRDIHVNLIGAFHCSRAVWPRMAEKGWGRIVNMSSITAQGGAFAAPGYSASKAGLLGLTRTLALEGGALGITVNAVMPGLIETEPIRRHGAKVLEKATKRIPAGRLGRPDDVAVLTAFLVSQQAGYITGAAVPVTGGIELFSM